MSRLIHGAICCLAAAGVWLQACAPVPAPLRRPGWQPQGDIRHLLEAGSALAGIADLTAAAQIRVTQQEGTYTASASFQYLPPSLLRVDVRGALFQHVLTVIVDADTLWSWSQGRLQRLDARDGLGQFLDIDLRGQDPAGVLLGLVDGFTAAELVRIEYPRADRAVIVVDDDKTGGQRRLWVDALSGFVVRDEGIDRDGQRRWQRRLQRYVRVGDSGLFLPRTVRIESGGRSLEVRYGEWRPNRGLVRAAFFRGLSLSG